MRGGPSKVAGVNSELGRYLEGRRLDMQKLLRALYDVGCGQGSDVSVRVDGRELVFARDASSGSRGFVRLIPGEERVVIAFPRGNALFDPARRLKGPTGAQQSLSIGHVFEIDAYLRRLIETAYAAD